MNEFKLPDSDFVIDLKLFGRLTAIFKTRINITVVAIKDKLKFVSFSKSTYYTFDCETYYSFHINEMKKE